MREAGHAVVLTLLASSFACSAPRTISLPEIPAEGSVIVIVHDKTGRVLAFVAEPDTPFPFLRIQNDAELVALIYDCSAASLGLAIGELPLVVEPKKRALPPNAAISILGDDGMWIESAAPDWLS